MDQIEKINKRRIRPVLHKVDLCEYRAIEQVFAENARTTNKFTAVIHFAGLKAVGESVQSPLAYYANNLTGTINLLRAMETYGVLNLVFSSSATVYGEANVNRIPENAPLSATNPYGRTKLMIEDILRDLVGGWHIVILRYFNPIGAHASGQLGENPNGIPNNIAPYIAQVAVGRLSHITIFGTDYPTQDGTGVRDYIHVVDLARGHLAALQHGLFNNNCEVFNLGTGVGISVRQLLSAFSKAAGKDLPFKIGTRRPGDIAMCVADPSKAATRLHWRTTLSLEQACIDTLRWQNYMTSVLNVPTWL